MASPLTDRAPKRLLWLAAIWSLVSIAWLLGACAGFQQHSVRGVLVAVRHDERYEAPCGVRSRLYKACDELPVCCSYRIVVRNLEGHETVFWAFWPRFAPGLLGLVGLGDTATFLLHTRYLYELQSCSLYGCPQRLEYTLDDDADVKR